MKQVIIIIAFTTVILAGLLSAADAKQSSIIADNKLFGYWLSEDQAIVVEITVCSPETDILCGFIRAVPGMNTDPELAQHAAELCHIPILSNLEFNKKKQRWDGGQIFDPETEQLYDVFVSVKGADLKVRAFEGVEALGETLTWTSVPASNYGCEEQ
jgi:uncharacterized protein (DUF2147 family)